MVLISHPKQTPSLHVQKRQGSHHRQSKHYSKTYWPYLTMFAVVICSFALNTLWTPTRQVLGYASDFSATSLLQRSNIVRIANGETPLTSNERLSEAAQTKANDMVKRNYWSHITPDGILPSYFVQNAGYTYTAIGENLAHGFDDSNAAINAWMNSPEHRANMLDKNYQEVGFGIANAREFQGKSNETIVVAMYGAPEAAGAAQSISGAQNVNNGAVLPMRQVSRLETVSTTHATIVAIASAVVAAGAAMFIALKHGRMLRKSIIHGEVFIVKHHLLDLTLLGIGGIGFVITRSAGVIH